MKVIAVIPAHMCSKRLPKKIMMPIAGEPMLKHTIKQVAKAQKINEIWVAATKNKEDDPIIELCKTMYDIHWMRGDETDIISRILVIANKTQADIIVDCDGEDVLIDPRMVDKAVEIIQLGYQSISFGHIAQGFGPAIAFTRDLLKAIFAEKKTNTDYRWGELFKDTNSYSIDTLADYERVKELVESKWKQLG